MRKIYALVLLAAALLVGTTAWAENVASWAELTDAAATPNAEIILTKTITMPTGGGTFDFKGAVIDCRYETTSAVTGSDTVVYNYLYASKAQTYTLQNVTLKNYQGSVGAIYSAAANVVINLENTVNIIDSKYSVYTKKAATITNAGNITGVYMKGGSLTNSGTITSAAAAGIAAAGTTTIENQAGAEITGATKGISIASGSVTNNGTITSTTEVGITVTGTATIENQAGAVITGATYGISIANGTVNNNGTINAGTHGVYVSGLTEFVNDGAINAASYSFNPAAAAQMTITNNANIDWSVYPYRANANEQSITNNAGNLTFYGYGSKAAYNFKGSVTIENAASANVIFANTNFACPLELTNVTINGGTFNGQLSGSNITIHGGTFAVAPAAGIDGYIEPQNVLPKFVEGVGDLTIASGYEYRSVDGYVAPIAPRVEVTHANGSATSCLIEEAFASAADGDVITLLEDVTSYSSLWLGTEDMDGEYKSVTLDLNGHTLFSATNVTRTITLTHGALYIVNSVPGQGGIAHMRSNAAGKSSDIIFVTGSTLKTVNPRTADIANLFTYLLVDEGVNITSNGDLVNGVVLSELRTGSNVSQVNYTTDIYKDYLNWEGEPNKQMGVANGVRIDIKGTIDVQKYGVKPNGNVRSPLEFLPEHAADGIAVNDTSYSAYIHIFPSAVVRTAADVESATAIYASGYARWLIEGTCQGATGVYAKSGVIDFNDAIVESTYTGEATITTGKNSGIEAGGNAVVVESNGAYTGGHSLVVNGDTKVSTKAEGGAAIVDVVDDNHTSKVDNITINGGSFSGDNGIVISSETATDESSTVTVNGVTVVGDISVGGSTDPVDVADIMGSNTHTTEVQNPDGSKTVIISVGDAPSSVTEWTAVAALTEGTDAKWTGFTAGVIANGETVKLGELQIISADGTTGKETQQLTIKNGATLNVDRLIMNDYARIIVEAGGKLIVEGTQGINAPNAENIVLNSQEEKTAQFLFHPKVSSNKHPKATFNFTSKSYRINNTEKVYQRFGIPTYETITDLKCYKNGVVENTIQTAFYKLNYTSGDWDMLGIYNSGLTDFSAFNEPYACYEMLTNDPTGKLTFAFEGALVGNHNAEIEVPAHSWACYANSYTADMDIATFLNNLNNVDKAIYVYKKDGPDNYTWESVNLRTVGYEFSIIESMQAFFVRNRSLEPVKFAVNYGDVVFNPGIATLAGAPKRQSSNTNMTSARIKVLADNGYTDKVYFFEDNEFSQDFDNGSDAEKCMNEKLNIYITAEEKMSIYAANDIVNTYIGFSTVTAGNYTLSFDCLNGERYALLDLETGMYVAIDENATYQFYADANSTNDYRFKIVSRQEMPTNMENVNAETVKNAGIYTITGQYVGEMNNWEKLPSGLYIVNGVKKVK